MGYIHLRKNSAAIARQIEADGNRHAERQAFTLDGSIGLAARVPC
jgi:hypothetical protein